MSLLTREWRSSENVLEIKELTFGDSGGISLKPSNNMALMKGDMGGAATVAGALYGISKLQLPVNIVGCIPLCENMPSGKDHNIYITAYACAVLTRRSRPCHKARWRCSCHEWQIYRSDRHRRWGTHDFGKLFFPFAEFSEIARVFTI